MKRDPKKAADLTLDEALALLSPSSPVRKLLRGLMEADEGTRGAALTRVERITEKERRVPKREAVSLLRVAVGLPFPPQQFDWNDSAQELIFPLLTSPYPELVPIARAGYPRLRDGARCAVLALLGAIGTRPAAIAFMGCIRDHGWPTAYGRVFTEMAKLQPHADVLFPELIERAGSNLGGVCDVLIDGLASGRIKLKRVNFELLAPLVAKSLRAALARAATHQRRDGTQWRFAEKYFAARRDAGAWLDLAGYLRTKTVGPLLGKGLAMRDPRLALFAAVATLRRKGKVPAAIFDRIAASHETREMLFEKLREIDALARFPKTWRTWDAFAAAHMVNWLLYPSELGHEPDAIEQMEVFTRDAKSLYVYRFRDGRGPWKAGVAGPFVRRGAPRPLQGHLTFSRFDKWDSATAEQHALAVLKTLKTWRAAR